MELEEGVKNTIAFIEAGKLNNAEVCLSNLLEEFEETSELLILKGRVLLEKKQYTEAVGVFVDATDKDKLSFDAHFYLGQALILHGWIEQAVLALKRAVEIDPTSAEAFIALADAYFKNGSKDETISVFKRAVELLKEATTVRNSIDDFPSEPPLHIGSVHYQDFEFIGNIENLYLQSFDTEKEYLIRFDLINQNSTKVTRPVVQEGCIPRERLIRSLNDCCKAKLEILTEEIFNYKIYDYRENV